MLEIICEKDNRVIVNNLLFSAQEFKSIGNDEASLLKYNYLAIIFTNKLKCVKDFNCNQDGINDESLLKVLNKIANKKESFFSQKRTEFDNSEISLEIQLQNKKNELISVRKNYLNSTDYKIIKAVENNIEIDLSLKTARQKAREEINEIEVSTSLEELNKFTNN